MIGQLERDGGDRGQQVNSRHAVRISAANTGPAESSRTRLAGYPARLTGPDMTTMANAVAVACAAAIVDGVDLLSDGAAVAGDDADADMIALCAKTKRIHAFLLTEGL